jgi:16S rRNA (guanine527-N7)-methyltransferase
VSESAREAASLAAGAAALEVPLALPQAEKLLAFRDLLVHWNKAFNLVSRHDQPRLIARHLLDSLSVAPDIAGTTALDLGTGAGLPGVPLAIALEHVRFTLVDRNARRIRFVARAVRELGLGNVEAHCMDVRALPSGFRYATVVCRAVAELEAAWMLAHDRLEPGGRLVILHRGQGTGAASAGCPAGARVESRREVRIPGLEQAHQVVILAPDGAARGKGPPAEQGPPAEKGLRAFEERRDQNHCCGQSEGRGGQDHHGRQSVRFLVHVRQQRAAGGPGSPG